MPAAFEYSGTPRRTAAATDHHGYHDLDFGAFGNAMNTHTDSNTNDRLTKLC